MALNKKFDPTKGLFNNIDMRTVSNQSSSAEEVQTTVEQPTEQKISTKEAKELVPSEFGATPLPKETPVPKTSELIKSPDLPVEELTLLGCGTTLPKTQIRFLQRNSARRGMSVQELLADILKYNYEHEKQLDDDSIDKIMDEYEENMRTNERRSFKLPKYLKTYWNEKAKEYGLQLNMLMFYYIQEYKKTQA